MSELEGGKEKDEKKNEIRYEKIDTIEIITNLKERKGDDDDKKDNIKIINYDILELVDLLKNYENKRKEYEKINEKKNKKIKYKLFYDKEIKKIKDEINYSTFYVPVNFKLDEKLLKKTIGLLD